MAFGKVVRTFWSAHLRHIKIDGEVGIPQCHPAAARLNRQRQEIPTRRDARSMQRCASKLLCRWMVEARCITIKRGGLQGWIATALPGRVRVLARLASDYGDPLRSRYEHVDYESTCIDCRKIGRPP